jgi:hypothetical protein
VRTLERLKSECAALGHLIEVISPDQFPTVPCPTYSEIRLAWRPGDRIGARLDAFRPDAVHLAIEGPRAASACAAACRSQPPTTPAFPNM